MKTGYTAASAFPYKLFRHDLSCGIPPVHVQYIPTNRCNLHCSFCSCENRDRRQAMGLSEVYELTRFLAGEGTKAVTITGGGEPLLHGSINEIIQAFAHWNIRIGLVTNGTQFDKLRCPEKLTWCRISASDEREMDFAAVAEVVKAAPKVDWAFSYVLSEKPDPANLDAHFAFAETFGFTHVRVVADLLHPDSVAMDEVRKQVDSPLAIWQPRTDAVPGAERCLIAKLKPVIGPDGSVYPCCGVQYAKEEMSLDLPDDMRQGHWRDGFHVFDGSECVRCYYRAYNEALAAITDEMAHVDFV